MHLEAQLVTRTDPCSLPATRLAKQPSGASDQDRYHSVPLRTEETREIATGAGGRGKRPTQANRAMRNLLGIAMRRLIALALLHLPLMGVGWTNRELVFAYPDDAPPPRRSIGGGKRLSPPAYR
jgi:hypothetical protein